MLSFGGKKGALECEKKRRETKGYFIYPIASDNITFDQHHE